MLLSRVADSLYWIGRYLERAEHTARLIDVRLDLGLDRTSNAGGWDFARLYSMVQLEEASGRRRPIPRRCRTRWCSTPANPAAVLACVTAARENAAQVREEISSDMWEQLNALFLRLKQARAEGGWSARPHYIFRLVIDGIHLFEGVTDETMGHGEGWQHLQLGRFLERASATAALVDLHFRRESLLPPGHAEWLGLLRSCSALEAYCRCYTADLRPERIAEFLLFNPEFPRSVRFAAARVESALRAIAEPHDRRRRRPGRAARRTSARLARLRAGGRDPERGSARVSRDHLAVLRADPRRRLSELHHVSDRVGAAGLRRPSCSTPSGTSRGSPTKRPSARASWKHACSRCTDASQRCIRFGLSTTPPSRVKMYQDHDGNIVHHFNIPGQALAPDGDRGGVRRVPGARAAADRPRRGRVGSPRRRHAVRPVLGRAEPEPVRPPHAAARFAGGRDRPRSRRRSAVHASSG